MKGIVVPTVFLLQYTKGEYMEHEKDTSVVETSATQWHPAFFGSLQIEFEKEVDKLIFESEHQLSTQPTDILVFTSMIHLKQMKSRSQTLQLHLYVKDILTN